MTQRPLILITNDDGITAPGIQVLIQEMMTLGNVIVVAPDKPQSGMGHAITVNNTLYLDKFSLPYEGVVAYSCSGTPADCVKLAVHELMTRKPDLCVSGINHGSNASINVLYSGTMSAAIEAGMEGIPSIGFSLCDFSHDANFEATRPFIGELAQKVLTEGLPEGVILNVNFPKTNDIKGIRVQRQARAVWEETFDKRQTPFGRDYYWLAGTFTNLDNGTDTDLAALDQSYVSVVPVQYDLTAYQAIQQLKSWEMDV
ncbi:MAG: 5'/3'-nucleotidase SurE [Flavobacterium sp. BFFFF2]|nr:MAG: 5'/3'-nucleotidase SurE [Flavobacterium sp. BFFFF2]